MPFGAAVRRHLAVIAGYGAITAVYTYPTVVGLTTNIPGKGDAPHFLWQLWWFKYSMLCLGQSPFRTRLVFHPVGDVAVLPETPVNEFLTIPLQAITGVVLLYNLLVLASFVLSGYFTYLLLDRLELRRDLAFVGGVIFAFCAYRGVRSLGHLSLLTTQWMPLSLLLLHEWRRRPTYSRGASAGLGLSLVALSSPYYVGYFLVPLAVVGAVYVLVWDRAALLAEARSAVLIAATVVALCAPFYHTGLRVSGEMRDAVRIEAASANVYVADLLSWVLPAGEHPFWGRYTLATYDRFTTTNEAETTVFFGFLPPLLAAASACLAWPGVRHVRFWQLLAGFTFVLSFGPVLHVAGEPVWPWMPYRLLALLPGFHAFRAPSRIGIVTVLAATVLAMLVVQRAMAARPHWPWRPGLAVWTVVLVFNTSFAFPYPHPSTAVPSVYRTIVATPGDFAVLAIPPGDENVGWYMYYQTEHRKPLVSGSLARMPSRLRAPERSMPFVRRFFTLPPSAWAADLDGAQLPDEVARARELLLANDIRYVVVHCDRLDRASCDGARAVMERALGPPIGRDGAVFLYGVVQRTGSANDV